MSTKGLDKQRKVCHNDPKNTNPTPKAKEAKMTDLDLTTSAGRTSEVMRTMTALNTTNSARVLSAMGHPGYGSKFATKALQAWQANPGQSMHQVVYGMQGR